jgi:hypothetical protein
MSSRVETYAVNFGCGSLFEIDFAEYEPVLEGN